MELEDGEARTVRRIRKGRDTDAGTASPAKLHVLFHTPSLNVLIKYNEVFINSLEGKNAR